MLYRPASSSRLIFSVTYLMFGEFTRPSVLFVFIIKRCLVPSKTFVKVFTKFMVFLRTSFVPTYKNTIFSGFLFLGMTEGFLVTRGDVYQFTASQFTPCLTRISLR